MPVQRLQRRDRGGQFHAIVGGRGFTAKKLFFMRAEAENGAPASRTGIAGTGAVGPDRNFAIHRSNPSSRVLPVC